MGFARYFQDAQTPEWKKAYINYCELQAELESLRAKTLSQANTLPTGDTYHHMQDDDFKGTCLYKERTSGISSSWVSRTDPTTTRNGTTDLSGHLPVPLSMRITSKQKRRSYSLFSTGLPPYMPGTAINMTSKEAPQLPKTPRSPVLPLFIDSGSPLLSPLHTMRSNLPINHAKFFDALDAELAKVEIFYNNREKEMHERAQLLWEQFEEFNIHRQIFHESSTHSKAQRGCLSVLHPLSSLAKWLSGFNTRPSAPHRVGNRSGRMDETSSSPKLLHNTTRLPPKRSNDPEILSFGRTKRALNPRVYQQAKTRLREAVIEHYRGLEVLNNYRILNLTCISKVLKKYRKINNISIPDAYKKEKVEPSALASGAMVTAMLKETERLFARHFERGNRKKAINHLRVKHSSRTYHVSTFRSGLWLGLALPAIGGGSYLAFQEHTRQSLPWDSLLYIYSILVLPVLLALLVGINVIVWTRTGINYAFILGLNPRSKLDHHEYFQLPSFLLCTLAYAFWFSLAQIGSPMLWTLIWFVLTLAVMFNPFRSFMWGHARWWTMKNMLKLVASGLCSVEFTHVWLADQLCSLVYSFSGLFFVGCFYIHFPNSISPSFPPAAYDLQDQEAWSKCSIVQNVEWYCLLGVSPYVVRCLQCLRLYQDSKVSSHLINAGKYGMGIVSQSCYCYWRYHGNPHNGPSLILWCFMATAHSLYGCSWDFLMDWSMFKPYARYPFLRPELLFKSHIPCYYFALVSDICIRFIWVTYIYVDEEYFARIQFISALLDVLLRAQWNIYRLENSHINNMNRYHVTREVPLPYSFDAPFDDKAHRGGSNA